MTTSDELVFKTSADSGDTPTAKMTIAASGDVTAAANVATASDVVVNGVSFSSLLDRVTTLENLMTASPPPPPESPPSPPPASGPLSINSCTASSEASGSQLCSQVYDDDTDTEWATNGECVGASITLTLAQAAVITSFSFHQRRTDHDTGGQLAIDFDGANQQLYSFSCTTSDCSSETFALTTPASATSITIVYTQEGTTACTNGYNGNNGNFGAKEVDLFGYSI